MEFFSAAATSAAKRKGGLTRYRSYKVGTYYDKISERYNHVDIFELTAYHIPLDFEKLRYYRENEKQPLITPAGQDGHIISLSREAYYADQGADHVVLPVELKVRRFKFASHEDLSIWEEESKEEGIVFAGAIDGITPVREILTTTGEAGLIHPASSDRDEQIRQATDSNGLFYSSKTINYHDYEENYFPAGPCGHYECPVCYGSLIQFAKPTWFIRGLPQDHEEVLTLRVRKAKEQKLKYLMRLAKMSEVLTTLSKLTDSIDAIDAIDKPSLDDYYQDMS